MNTMLAVMMPQGIWACYFVSSLSDTNALKDALNGVDSCKGFVEFFLSGCGDLN